MYIVQFYGVQCLGTVLSTRMHEECATLLQDVCNEWPLHNRAATYVHRTKTVHCLHPVTLLNAFGGVPVRCGLDMYSTSE